MADTYIALAAEFAARGYDYLDSTRVSRYINRGYLALCDEYPWPFLETELTAQTAPVTIADLDQVLYVADATNNQEIYGEDQRTVSAADPARSASGSPLSWYITGGTVLNLYPANTSVSLTIRYIKVPTEISGSTEPLVPQRYRNLITDYAVYLALKDNDEWDAAMAAKTLWDAEVQKMYARLAHQNMQNPGSIVNTQTYPYPY